MSFSGEFLSGDPTRMSVWFGTPTQPEMVPCALIPAESSTTITACSTQPNALGWTTLGALHARIVINGDESGAVTGTDQLLFPSVPVVLAVWGCSSGVSTATNSTSACDTRGGQTLTVCGEAFGNSPSILVDSNACGLLMVLTGPSLLALPRFCVAAATCRLPEGAGLLKPVIVSSNAQSSVSARLLSYSLPVVQKVRLFVISLSYAAQVTGCSQPTDPTNINGTD